MGYHRSGFDVIGFDVLVQPRYPFSFAQADAIEVLEQLLVYGSYEGIPAPAAIHASMPCQRWSTQTKQHGPEVVASHPDLIGPVRELLQAWGGVWVMENIPAAPLRRAVLVCGAALGLTHDGYWLKRHRHFEFSSLLSRGTGCGCHPGMRFLDVTGGGPTTRPRLDGGGGRPHKGTAEQVRSIMGMPWATKGGCNEAIPPAYTEFVGRQLLYLLERQAA